MREFAQHLVCKGAVDVEGTALHDGGAAVHVHVEGVVVDPGSVRVYRERTGEVVEPACMHLDALAGLGLHRARLPYRLPGRAAVFLRALNPLEELVAVRRRHADVVDDGRALRGGLDVNAAVSAHNARDGHAATARSRAVQGLLSPEQGAGNVVDLEPVGPGLVADDDGAPVVVQDNLLRVPGAQVVGIGVRRVVGGGQVHLEPPARVVAAGLCLELFL